MYILEINVPHLLACMLRYIIAWARGSLPFQADALSGSLNTMGRVILLALLVLLLVPQHQCKSSASKIVYEKEVAVTVSPSCKVIIQEGEDVCGLLRKYVARWTRENGPCNNITLPRLQTEVMEDLLSHPSTLSRTVMTENMYIGCSLQTDQVCRSRVQPYWTSWSIDRERFLDTALEILRNDSLPEEVEQRFLYHYEERIIEERIMKLTSLEIIKLFSRAYMLRPNSSLILNRFGQGLELVGRDDLKNALYDNAVRNGLWPSTMQRPEIDYISGLTSQPWHNTSNFAFAKVLEDNYLIFREELENLLNTDQTMFSVEGENLNTYSGGDWKALILKSHEGYSNLSSYLPQSTQILRSIGDNFLLVKFSALQPGTHIQPHTGPSNRRLRAHFCITHTGGARMRVGNEWRTWKEGKVLILDSSFEHEVVHNGPDQRIVLILDIWHPEYSP